jgi:hypothetical protein
VRVSFSLSLRERAGVRVFPDLSRPDLDLTSSRLVYPVPNRSTTTATTTDHEGDLRNRPRFSSPVLVRRHSVFSSSRALSVVPQHRDRQSLATRLATKVSDLAPSPFPLLPPRLLPLRRPAAYSASHGPGQRTEERFALPNSNRPVRQPCRLCTVLLRASPVPDSGWGSAFTEMAS